MTATRAVASAYAALVALAATQVATDRADVDAPITFAAGAIVVVAVTWSRVSGRVLTLGVAGVSAALSAWTLVALGVALARHGGEPSSFYAVKVAVVTPVAAHNVLASLLLVGLVAATMAVAEDRRWWIAVVLTTLALGATLSRGATLVGLLLPVGAWLLRRDRQLVARLAATTLAALALVLIAAGALDASVPDPGGPDSVTSRGELWAAGWDAFASRPVTGIGFDGFAAHATSLDVADPRDHAHDLFLHAAATGGVIALLAVIALWGTLGAQGWRIRDEATRTFVLLGGGVLFIHSLIEETAFRPAIEVLLALLLGLALGARPPASPPPPSGVGAEV